MSSSAGETEAALVALLHLIRLMGAELVAGKHRDDVEMLVKAAETKLRAAMPSMAGVCAVGVVAPEARFGVKEATGMVRLIIGAGIEGSLS